MIWCDGVERWLNDGMPPRGAAAAREHARRCDACARAIEDAVALDAMLAAAVTAARPAPAGFTDAVMARVDAERDFARAPGRVAAATATADAGPRATTPWWLVLASEPAAAVAITLVPAAVLIALFVPAARDFVVASTRLAVSSSLTATLNGVTAASSDASALLNAMSPVARSALAAGLLSLLFWWVDAAPTWLVSKPSRRRGSLPRSRP